MPILETVPSSLLAVVSHSGVLMAFMVLLAPIIAAVIMSRRMTGGKQEAVIEDTQERLAPQSLVIRPAQMSRNSPAA